MCKVLQQDQPLLFVLSPSFNVLRIAREDESTSVFNLEDLQIKDTLIANQLRFFSRAGQRLARIKFHLVNGEELIGVLLSISGASVCIEANGTKIWFDGNEIKKIERL